MIELRDQLTTSIVSSVQGAYRYAGLFGYSSKWNDITVEHNANAVALVNALFFSGRPFTVFWRVWSVIVDAFNTVFGSWSNSHIQKKIIKGILPSITDKNSTLAVIFVRLVGRITATLSYMHPRQMFRAIAHPVACFGFGYLDSRSATTTSALAAIEVASEDVSFFSADAPTWNIFHCFFPVRVSDNSPVSKGCSNWDDRELHVDYLRNMTPIHYTPTSIEQAGV